MNELPLICSTIVVCFVSYSAPTAKFGRSFERSVDLSISILSDIPVFLSFTVVKSSLMERPATAEGARFFLAVGRGGGGGRGRGEGGREEGNEEQGQRYYKNYRLVYNYICTLSTGD